LDIDTSIELTTTDGHEVLSANKVRYLGVYLASSKNFSSQSINQSINDKFNKRLTNRNLSIEYNTTQYNTMVNKNVNVNRG